MFQAWLTFAIFDNAPARTSGSRSTSTAPSSATSGSASPRSAAANPEAWFPIERTAEEIITAGPTNRMVGYPYTKYMVSIMDVDMAAALLLTSHETADELGVPGDQRVYLRGWCYATDPVYVAEHVDLWRSPAMEAASSAALAVPRASASTTSRTSTCTRASARR